MFILDTNVVSEFRRASPDAQVVAWARRHRPSDFHLSAMTVFDLELGLRRIERRDEVRGARLRRWLDAEVLDLFRGRILPIDTAIAVRSASLHVPERRPERDCLIAATPLVHGMTVVTRNEKGIRLLGVPVVNPWGV